MLLKPPHLAAVWYSVLSAFLWAVWFELLFPADRALGQLQVIFAEGYPLRTFFFCLALSTLLTPLLALTFCLPVATSPIGSPMLAATALGVFALAAWQFDAVLQQNFGLGCIAAFWAWRRPNQHVFASRIAP
jgi:hypothetical protein